ncbi:hypothetical protein [Streptomyces sp. ODS28]|uniref:hypothetical protein n=1 Tax=Streptomyces sp. ODS28 TaxID=3136688 RepID=UPI0031EFF684
MRLRHVRTVAVCGIALVLLTGARGSHGGSCGGSSHSSSSGSHSDTDTDTSSTGSGGTDGGSDVSKDDSTGGGSSGGSGSLGGGIGGGSRNDALRDLRITDCSYDEARGVTAKISATNNTSDTVDYKFSVKFTDGAGKTIGVRNRTIPVVQAGATDTQDVSTAYVPEQGQTASGKCKITKASRTASDAL